MLNVAEKPLTESQIRALREKGEIVLEIGEVPAMKPELAKFLNADNQEAQDAYATRELILQLRDAGIGSGNDRKVHLITDNKKVVQLLNAFLDSTTHE